MLTFLKKLWNKKRKNGYYFIHIPKTAGTSFINLLDGCVNEAEIFPVQLWHQVNSEIIRKKKKFRLLRGHFGGGSYQLLCDNNPHRLTILRHPQSLSVSTYHFIKREKNTAVHDLVTNKNLTLKEFLEEPLTALKVNNRMVRHLSFDLQEDPEAQELFLSAQSINVVKKWIKSPKKINSKQRYERAINALNACSWFGIQENFDQSMQLFSYTFNRPPFGKSPYLNAHKPNQKIDKYCQDLILKQNEYDMQLYQYATNLFQQRHQEMCHKLQQKFMYQELSLDEMIDKNYQQSHTENLKSDHDYHFGMELLGSGWHRRELTLPENTFFRWTNNRKAFIDFWVTPNNYTLEIRVINAVTEKHLNALELHINDKPVPYTYDTNNGVVRIIQAEISHTIIKNNLIRIEFNQPETLKHQDEFDSDDTRYLGIAVNWIKIQKCQK
ncbi:MAG: hypothetical protein AB8B80_01125 [Marinicellaceae bacterium]